MEALTTHFTPSIQITLQALGKLHRQYIWIHIKIYFEIPIYFNKWVNKFKP